MSDNGYRCGHASCECTVVESGGDFCSEHCAAAAESGDTGVCRCGHEACEHRQARERQAGISDNAGPT